MVLALSVSTQVRAIDPFDYRSGQALNRPHHEHEHPPSLAAATYGAAGDHEHEHEQENEKGQKYTCPMHPEVITDHPGHCPKCGMKLVLKEQEPKPEANSDRRKSHGMRNLHAGPDMHQRHSDGTVSHETHRLHPAQGHESNEMPHMQMTMQSSVNIADPMEHAAR